MRGRTECQDFAWGEGKEMYALTKKIHLWAGYMQCWCAEWTKLILQPSLVPPYKIDDMTRFFREPCGWAQLNVSKRQNTLFDCMRCVLMFRSCHKFLVAMIDICFYSALNSHYLMKRKPGIKDGYQKGTAVISVVWYMLLAWSA